MSTALEIERKFLIEFPNLDLLDIKEKISIVQIYLKSGENNSQRRVRKIDDNGSVSYTYTEKIFLTPVTRQETECIINKEDYESLLSQAKQECNPVQKTRYIFDYKSQYFEMDTYPFSNKLAILELELNDPNQEILFPEYIKIIKEVSDDSRYSNSALANAGAFPK